MRKFIFSLIFLSATVSLSFIILHYICDYNVSFEIIKGDTIEQELDPEKTVTVDVSIGFLPSDWSSFTSTISGSVKSAGLELLSYILENEILSNPPYFQWPTKIGTILGILADSNPEKLDSILSAEYNGDLVIESKPGFRVSSLDEAAVIFIHPNHYMKIFRSKTDGFGVDPDFIGKMSFEFLIPGYSIMALLHGNGSSEGVLSDICEPGESLIIRNIDNGGITDRDLVRLISAIEKEIERGTKIYMGGFFIFE